MYKPVPVAVRDWLIGEYAHSREKFGFCQSDDLKRHDLLAHNGFGGQASSYWSRMHNYDDDNPLHRAQYAGKMANSSRMLWSTLRALEWDDNKIAADHSARLISESLTEDGFGEAKRYAAETDFYATPIGLGLGFLGENFRRQGFERRYRLGQLIRAEQIMLDAGALMALQFERSLDLCGQLPAPGYSSGNIVTWTEAPE